VLQLVDAVIAFPHSFPLRAFLSFLVFVLIGHKDGSVDFDCVSIKQEIHRIVSQKQLPAGEGSASDRPGDGGMVITPTQGDTTGGAGGAKQKCCNV